MSSAAIFTITSMQKNRPEKGAIFVQSSIFNCVYHKSQTDKMSTKLHAVCNVFFGNVNFVLAFSNTHGRNRRFSASTQSSLAEKSIFGHFEVIFFNL